MVNGEWYRVNGEWYRLMPLSGPLAPIPMGERVRVRGRTRVDDVRD